MPTRIERFNVSKKRIGKTLLTVAAVLSFSSCNLVPETLNAKAKDGVLDLTAHNFQSEPIVLLGGEWEFFPNVLATNVTEIETLKAQKIDVPGTWNGDGYGTYHLRLTLPEASENFRIHMTAQLTAYDVFVDGRLRAVSGKPGRVKAETRPSTSPLTWSLTPGTTHNIFLRIANFHHRKGGLFAKIRLAPQSVMVNAIKRSIFMDLVLGGVLAMMAIHYIFVFFYRYRNFAELFFALVCVTILTRTLTTGEKTLLYLWPSAPFILYSGLEYVSYFWAVPLGLAFFSCLTSGFMPRVIAGIFCGIAALFSISVIILPLRLYSHTAYIYLPIAAVGILLIAVYLVRLLFKRDRDAILMGLGFLFIIFAAANDALNTLEVIHTAYILQFGFFGMVACFSAVLARRFANSFTTIEEKSQELELANEQLEERILSRTDELNRAKLAAEDANRRKANFLSLISHDLRSPLSGVFSVLQLLQGGLASKESEVRMLAASEKSIGQMLSIITTLTELHRATFQKIEERQLVSPSILFDKDIETYCQNNPERRARIVNKLDPEWKIITHAPLLSHLLRNLVSNALKFSEADKQVTIYRLDDKANAIAVEDKGVGMPPERVDAILQNKRIYATKSVSGEEGIGLGLTICRDLLIDAGGRLEVRSVLGEGSTFIIVLPT